MRVVVERGIISGTVTAPPSKSMTQRAFAGALLHKGITTIEHAGQSDDERAALGIIEALGAEIIHTTDDSTTVSSYGVLPVTRTIDCRESGLSARLFTPIAALSNDPIRIEGKGTLLKRPMEGIQETLQALGVALPDFSGHIPFAVQGPLQARSTEIDAGSGSQLLSGLLFALAASATETITLKVKNLKSKPYIDLTLDVLEHFGKPIVHDDYRIFHIDPARFVSKEDVDITIKGDWSGAANLLVAGAIAGKVTVENLDINSSQADRAILSVLREAGAGVQIEGNNITVSSAVLQPFEFDATDCPDLFPILSILGACTEGECHIRGVHRLFFKESNRIESITQMLDDFIVPYSVEDDVLTVWGTDHFRDTVIDSYNDHRIVMAAAVGALRAKGPVTINGAEAVQKSYPTFFADLAKCGIKCENS